MDHFAGLDVSVKETGVCIVDETGKIVREMKLESEPDALVAVLKNPSYHFKRIGLEAGPLSQWLFSALADARDGVGTITTEKTGTEVTLPILPVLAETLAVGPCGDLALIANKNGQPFAKEAFGNAFKDACRAAGVPGSAHGLRKIAATRAANAGATVAQLEAIFGWSGGRTASLYTRAADRRRLAIEGMHKLANS
jgi:integrase